MAAAKTAARKPGAGTGAKGMKMAGRAAPKQSRKAEPAPAPAPSVRVGDPGASSDDPQERGLALMRSRFKAVVERETGLRAMMTNDLEARVGNLWDPKIKNDRKLQYRPVVEVNKLPQYEHQVIGEIRQNEPVIGVVPRGAAAHQEVADALKGRIRYIHARSKAKAARLTAVEGAWRTGRGHYRILTVKVPGTQREEIRISRIRNPLSVYLDTLAENVDRSDAKWGFVVTEMDIDEYGEDHPEAGLAGFDLGSAADTRMWLDGRTIRVAEYFFCDGEPGEDDCRWTWWKTNGKDVLDETEWPGLWLPILTVIGDEVDIAGTVTLEGGIRHAKVPLQMLSYARSTEVESLGLTVKRKMMGTPEMFEGHEVAWQNANSSAELALPVNADPNMPGMFPREIFPRGPDTGALALANSASQDLHDATGQHPASLGMPGAETSGIAIGKRQMEGDTGNFHFTDNLAQTMEHEGRMLIDLIRKVDIDGLKEEMEDGTAELETIQEDNSPKVVRLGTKAGKPEARFERNDVNGKTETVYDPTVGYYESEVSQGPAFQSRRQEAAAGMAEVFKAAPLPFLQVAGDLLIELQDWPGADRLAKRFRHLLMAPIQQELQGAEGEGGDDVQKGRQAQAMLAKLAPVLQMMQQQLAMAKQALADKNQEMALKHMQIMLDYQAQVIEAQGNVKAAELNAMGHMGRELARGVATRHAALPGAGVDGVTDPGLLDAGDPAAAQGLPFDEQQPTGQQPGQDAPPDGGAGTMPGGSPGGGGQAPV